MMNTPKAPLWYWRSSPPSRRIHFLNHLNGHHTKAQQIFHHECRSIHQWSSLHMKSHIKHYELLGDANLLNQLLLHRLGNETCVWMICASHEKPRAPILITQNEASVLQDSYLRSETFEKVWRVNSENNNSLIWLGYQSEILIRSLYFDWGFLINLKLYFY